LLTGFGASNYFPPAYFFPLDELRPPEEPLDEEPEDVRLDEPSELPPSSFLLRF
jgi:hypothetical protein